MNEMRASADSNVFNPPRWRSFWAIAVALTLLRFVVLIFSQTEVGPDEAQYWYWSRDLDFGYFSKPPLIAWAIGATTALFGNDAWAVRLSAPLFHFGTAIFLYLIARDVFDKRIAFWTGLGWLTLPGVILSSFIIATDAPLLFFWSGALYFLFRIVSAERPARRDFARLGFMIGMGLLSKYAMMYFIAATALAMLYRPLRRKLLHKGLAWTAIIACALFLPNVVWNLQHDFQTLTHTAANANWDASLFRPLNLLTFLSEQFLVFGAIPFATLLFVSFRREPRLWLSDQLLLAIFALTPILVVALQAFIARAHANWAAAAYPAAMLLVTAFLFRAGAEWLAKASVALHGFALFAFSIGVLNLALVDRLGLSGAVKDVRGWEQQAAEIVARGDGYDAILVDDRYLISEMLYHQYDAADQIFALDPNASVSSHFEAFKAFDPERHKRVLFVTTRDDPAHVDYRFRSIEWLGVVETPLGGARPRRYTLYALADYFGPDLD